MTGSWIAVAEERDHLRDREAQLKVQLAREQQIVDSVFRFLWDEDLLDKYETWKAAR